MGMFVVLFIVAAVLGVRSYQAAIRDSSEIIIGIEAENDRLAGQLEAIANALSGFGTGLGEAAGSVSSIGSTVESVGEGLDESIRFLGELIDLVGRIEDIVEGRTVTFR